MKTCFLLLLLWPALPAGEPASLEQGFVELYHLRFSAGRALFEERLREAGDDPLAAAALGASYLFEEFEQHGVLTSEFFLDDDRLLGGIKGRPDRDRMRLFASAIERSRSIADQRLDHNPLDSEALLAITIGLGMRANASVLIEKDNLKALSLTREGESWGRRLIATAPNQKDGYMAVGAASYIIGCLPFYKRAILRLGGIKGDRELGMTQLGFTARDGFLLRPYAKIMLALACLREKQPARARLLLEELVTEFPASPLFRRELGKIGLRWSPR
jgi:hypothetical protein